MWGATRGRIATVRDFIAGALIVVGVGLFVWGASGLTVRPGRAGVETGPSIGLRTSDDRRLVAIGAGLTVAGVLLRRRQTREEAG